MNYYHERAAAYVRTAQEFDALGLLSSAKRARDKAAFYDRVGDRYAQTLVVRQSLVLRHERFLQRASRKHRWWCRAWGMRCQHMREDQR